MKIQQIPTSESKVSPKHNTATSPSETFVLPPDMSEMTAAELLEFLRRRVVKKMASSSGTKPEAVKAPSPTVIAEETKKTPHASPKTVSGGNSKSTSPEAISRKGNLKRKAEHSPQGRESKQKVSTSFGDNVGQGSQPSFTEYNRWLEYMLRCALSRIDNLQEEVKIIKKELDELKAKQYMKRTETEASEDEDDTDVDDEEEEEADDSEDV